MTLSAIVGTPSLAGRTYRYSGMPFAGRGACSANSPSRPPSLAPVNGRGEPAGRQRIAFPSPVYGRGWPTGRERGGSRQAAYCNSLPFTGEGWSRGFAPHAARLRNGGPMQRAMRPARESLSLGYAMINSPCIAPHSRFRQSSFKSGLQSNEGTAPCRNGIFRPKCQR